MTVKCAQGNIYKKAKKKCNSFFFQVKKKKLNQSLIDMRKRAIPNSSPSSPSVSPKWEELRKPVKVKDQGHKATKRL